MINGHWAGIYLSANRFIFSNLFYYIFGTYIPVIAIKLKHITEYFVGVPERPKFGYLEKTFSFKKKFGIYICLKTRIAGYDPRVK